MNKKVFYFWFVFIVLLNSNLFAQDFSDITKKEPKKITFLSMDLKVFVPGLAWYSHVEYTAPQYSSPIQLSYGFGLGLGLNFTKRISLHPEFIYIVKGGQDTIFSNIGGNNVELSYIEIPILLQYRGRRWFFETGPAFGFLFDVNAGVTEGSGGIPADYPMGFYNNSDFSWIFGGGLHAGLHFGMSLRYDMGIANIASINNYEPKLTNNTCNLILYWEFISRDRYMKKDIKNGDNPFDY